MLKEIFHGRNVVSVDYLTLRNEFLEAYYYEQSLDTLTLDFHHVPSDKIPLITDTVLMQEYIDVVNAIREYMGHDKKKCSIRDRKKV